MDQEFDYLVLGGGTAGSVIAKRLSEDGSTSVCVVEAGPSDEGRPEILELQRWPELLQSQYDWDYEAEPQENANSEIRGSRARVLGGCSSHNVALAWRAPDVDLQAWVDLGAAGWSPAECAPVFDRVFERTGLEWAPSDGDGAAAFIEACRQEGYPDWQGLANGNNEGAGWSPMNVRWPYRGSASVSYLHPLSELPSNLTLLLETRFSRLLIEDGVAVGAETSAGTLRARREVFVCGGAFESPKLLMSSGIGPGSHLQDLGIPVIADLPVGRHLLDHPEGVVAFETTKPLHQPATSWCDSVLLAKVPGSDAPAPELMMWFFSGDFEGFTTEGGEAPLDATSFTLAPDVTRPHSQGWVELRSADPMDPPRIQYGYFNDPDGYDINTMMEGLRMARRIADQPALQPWVAKEKAPGADVQDAELEAYARATSYTAHHPSGTCKMGAASDSTAVVDPELRVRGVRNLRVADASIFPTVPGVNPCITVMMVGERAAELAKAAS